MAEAVALELVVAHLADEGGVEGEGRDGGANGIVGARAFAP